MGRAWVAPRVRDYGDLLSMTADGGAMLHVGIGSPTFIAAMSAPIAPGGGGGDTLGKTQADTLASGGGGHGGSLGATGTQPGGGAGSGPSGVGGSGGGGSGGGGHLPFTGLAAAAMGAVGSGLAATGLALRRLLRRDR
jgi:hypothetical protein